jgi:hypothetical protein
MEVGTNVFCTSVKLGLQNQPGIVAKTCVLGCKDSIIVALDTGNQVAFFGPKIACVSTEPLAKDPTVVEETTTEPLAKDPTVVEETTTEQTPPSKSLVRKRSTRKKSTN